MKVFRTIIVTFLILIIVGGLGYIGWNLIGMPGMSHGGTSTDTTAGSQNHSQMPDMQNDGQSSNANTNSTSAMNLTAVQNRDKLIDAITMINQAMDMITLDPYSKATKFDTAPETADETQPAQGTSGLGILPGSNSNIIIINPDGSTPSNTPSNTPPNPNINQGDYVYDQAKLEQLHNGIFTLAQGIRSVSSLGDDLLLQQTITEANPATYDTFVLRYNLALQNKTKLENALNMISQGSTLINVNPYASPDGYQYDKEAMERLHNGIYKLAEGVALLTELNENFATQMVNASMQGQYLLNQSGNNQNMNHSTGIFGTVNATTIFQIVLAVMAIGLIAGIIGAIYNMFKPRNKNNGVVTEVNYTE